MSTRPKRKAKREYRVRWRDLEPTQIRKAIRERLAQLIDERNAALARFHLMERFTTCPLCHGLALRDEKGRMGEHRDWSRAANPRPKCEGSNCTASQAYRVQYARCSADLRRAAARTLPKVRWRR